MTGANRHHKTANNYRSPTALAFSPRQRMTRWFEPVAMFRLLLRIWATRRMADQRQNQPDQPPKVFDFSADTDDDGELWFDYVADLGDAFDPTMAVAWHLGRRGLDRAAIDPNLGRDPEFALPDDLPRPPHDDIPNRLPRGRLLIMGGDQVYPNGSDARYRNQVTGPYGLAWEDNDGSADDRASDGETGLLAIPANHDWYGGIGPFRRAFCSGNRIAGWRTAQTCSWWAARLPHDWWVWGVDTALDGTINQRQVDYFRSVCAEMDKNARVIACVPVPPWRLRERHVDQLDHLARFFSSLGVEPEVYLSGDYHISALHRRDRTDGVTEWHLTSGGGGAFQHPVHNLDLEIPNRHGGLPEPEVADRQPFHKVASWPSNAESREGSGSWWDLLFDRTAYTLVAALACVQLLVMRLAGANRRGIDGQGVDADLRSAVETLVDLYIPVGAIATVGIVVIATFVLARANSAARGAVRWARAVGFGHGIIQAAVFTVAGLVGNLAVRVTAGGSDGMAATIVATLTLAVIATLAGVASIVVLGSYLRFANRQFRMHDNESYSARHSGENRHFSRFRVGEDGSLSCYVIAIRAPGRDWASAFTDGDSLPPPTSTDPELIDVRFRTPPRFGAPHHP